MNRVIAIDGPAGAGKSTVAKILARRLGLRYLDTGAMYRAVALLATRAGLQPEDGAEAARLAEQAEITFGHGDPQPVLVNGEDITSLIRTPEISELASALSAHSALRQVLVARQKELIQTGDWILEGRDTTTVVAPHATVKVFLTASLEERAKRRSLELGREDVGELTRMISERDHRDYTREDSPLTMSPDAHRLETFGLSAEEVANRIAALLP